MAPPVSRRKLPLSFNIKVGAIPDLRCLKFTLIETTRVISSPNPMFYHLLESSRRDDSNKSSNIGLGEEIDILVIKLHNLSGTLARHAY